MPSRNRWMQLHPPWKFIEEGGKRSETTVENQGSGYSLFDLYQMKLQPANPGQKDTLREYVINEAMPVSFKAPTRRYHRTDHSARKPVDPDRPGWFVISISNPPMAPPQSGLCCCVSPSMLLSCSKAFQRTPTPGRRPSPVSLRSLENRLPGTRNLITLLLMTGSPVLSQRTTDRQPAQLEGHNFI